MNDVDDGEGREDVQRRFGAAHHLFGRVFVVFLLSYI